MKQPRCIILLACLDVSYTQRTGVVFQCVIGNDSDLMFQVWQCLSIADCVVGLYYFAHTTRFLGRPFVVPKMSFSACESVRLD